MAALFLAPLYILINAYVVRWMIRWMGACHRLFQTMAFRASSGTISSTPGECSKSALSAPFKAIVHIYGSNKMNGINIPEE